MKLFQKLLDKKLQQLGYVKKEEILSQVVVPEPLAKNFDPRLNNLELETSDIKIQSKGIESRVEDKIESFRSEILTSLNLIKRESQELAQQTVSNLEKQVVANVKGIEQLWPLFSVCQKLREGNIKVEDLEKSLIALEKDKKDIIEEQKALRERLNALARASDAIPKIEKAAAAFEDLKDLSIRMDKVEEKVGNNIRNTSHATKAMQTEIKSMKTRLAKARINGHPITSRTELFASELKVSKDSNITLETDMHKKFSEQLKLYKNDLDKDYKEKTLAYTEVKGQVKELNDRIDTLTKVSANVGGIVEQRSFNEIYNDVVRKNKQNARKKKAASKKEIE